MAADYNTNQLLEAIARGDRTAFGLLYDSHASTIYAQCAQRFTTPAKVDGAFSAVWLFVWRHAPQLSVHPADGSRKLHAATAVVLNRANSAHALRAVPIYVH